MVKSPSWPRMARTSAPVCVPDVGGPQALAGEGRGLGHRDVGQAELQAAVVHHDVEEVGHVRGQGEGGDPAARRSAGG